MKVPVAEARALLLSAATRWPATPACAACAARPRGPRKKLRGVAGYSPVRSSNQPMPARTSTATS